MGFDNRRVSTLELKFKRHKIDFNYDLKTNKIIIGKSKNTTQKLIFGISSIVVSILLLITLIYLQVPMGRLINYILTPAIAIFGLRQLLQYYSLRDNKETKIISVDSIQIGDSKYLKDDITEFDISVESDDNGENSSGILSILTAKEKKTLITIIDENHKYVKNDLNFLKTLILDFMNDN